MKLIVENVYKGLKRKRSNHEEAKRLDLSLADYKIIKKAVIQGIYNLSENENIDEAFFIKVGNQIFKTKNSTEVYNKEIHENLEKGETKITAISSVEPRTPEEIIKLLGIDTKLWKLSQYWNKEQNNKWLVSALVTKIKQEELQENNFVDKLKDYKLPAFKEIKTKHFNDKSTERICGVISLQDVHFGKPGNENISETVQQALLYLVGKAFFNYNLEKIILIIGGDTLNVDTFNNTTTKGTIVESSETAVDAYMKAFNCLSESIAKIKEYCNNLEIVFIPGNHDRLSSFHLVHALSKLFIHNPDIIFNTEYAERKVLMYGSNFIGLEHGDVSSRNNPLVYAIEFPQEWGSTKFRFLYTGHYHGRKTKEVITENEENGFVTRILPALTSSDYYHYHNKWTGNHRSAIMQIHEYDKGLISEFVYTV